MAQHTADVQSLSGPAARRSEPGPAPGVPLPEITAPPTRRLTRDDLVRDSPRHAYLRSLLPGVVWSDARLRRSLYRTLGPAARGDVWLFAYGSLIWNPLLPVAEQRVARVHGLSREFGIWSKIGRGTPEHPGLMLGLAPGGQCDGIALRIAQRHVRDELTMLWRREMLTGSYAPTWVRARTRLGAVRAIAFVTDPRGPNYAGRLPDADVARIVARASGLNGSCLEYLTQTLAGLQAHGLSDARLARLVALCGGSAAGQK